MADYKSYPLALLDNLNSIKEFFTSNKIKDYKIHKPSDNGILEVYHNHRLFYFLISNFEIKENILVFIVNIYPLSETSVEKVETRIASGQLIQYLKIWWSLVTRYSNYENLFDNPIEIKYTRNTNDFSIGKLPVCLKQIQVKNYNAIKATEIIDIPEDSLWVFLIGENGFGKTLILQSIFIGLFGTRDNNTILVKQDDFKVLVEFNDGEKKALIKTNYESDITLEYSSKINNIVAIGASRLNLTSISAKEEETRSSPSYSLFNTDGLLLNIDSELYKLSIKKEKKKFDAFKKGLIDLLAPYLSDIKYNEELDKILYYEKDNNNEDYIPSRYDDLASGFKSIIGIAGDIIIRLSKNQDVKNIKDLEGIVLIDEFDLHWHPKLQINVPMAFSKVFPKIQFIVSTHSPIPLLGAPLSSKVYKVNRSKEDGVTVEEVELNLKQLTPNLILTSPIFDMDSITNINTENLDEIKLEDSFNEIETNENIKSILSDIKNTDKKYPDSIFK